MYPASIVPHQFIYVLHWDSIQKHQSRLTTVATNLFCSGKQGIATLVLVVFYAFHKFHQSLTNALHRGVFREVVDIAWLPSLYGEALLQVSLRHQTFMQLASQQSELQRCFFIPDLQDWQLSRKTLRIRRFQRHRCRIILRIEASQRYMLMPIYSIHEKQELITSELLPVCHMSVQPHYP